MEVSALRYSGGIGLHGRSPLLRLQSDERLIALVRRGNTAAYEVIVSRYNARLLAFCRHMLGSREDAEDVLQDVFAAAFNAIHADEREINVRPWLYRIARNRSLNHLRRAQAIGVDSMDVHLSEHGASTADKAHDRETFRLLIDDIQGLPETQRTALVLREMDALSYEQIAEAMETTVPGVKSLLVRARISLAEAAEARALTCGDVRLELGAVAEGLQKRPGPLVRRHLRTCQRCGTFQAQLKTTNKALAALLPLGPMALLRKLAIIHLGHSAGTGSSAGAGATAGGAGAAATSAGAGAASAPVAAAGALGSSAAGSAGGLLSAGAAALTGKAAVGLAAAVIVTAGAIDVTHTTRHRTTTNFAVAAAVPTATAAVKAPHVAVGLHLVLKPHRAVRKAHKLAPKPAPVKTHATVPVVLDKPAKPKPTGTTETQTDPTVLTSTTPTSTTPTSTTPTSTTPTSTTPTSTTPTSTTPTSTTPTSATPASGSPSGS